MGIRRLILFIALLTAILGGLTGVVLRTPEAPEPVYQGKSLSAWLETYKFIPPEGYQIDFAHFEEMTNAVFQIGTNAIPTLLRMLRDKDSGLKLKFIELIHKQSLVTNYFRPPAAFRNFLAAKGFEALGTSASNAVPTLIAIHDKNISEASQFGAIDSLAGIGPTATSAIPSLVTWLASTNESIRCQVLLALRRIHANPSLVVPVFIKHLHDQDSDVRFVAAVSLEEWGVDAQTAVPALTEALKDQDSYVTNAAASALMAINPAAAAKAGIK